MVDARLPHLEKILDPELVLDKFKQNFHSQFAANNHSQARCTIERVQHKKGKRCRVLYRLVLSNGTDRQVDHWFYGKLVKPGQARNQFQTALASEELARGEWPAVSLWEDWDLILWAFPNDPDMPKLRIAADPDFVRGCLNENIHKFGLDLEWRCETVYLDRVKYMPGKRCVLRINAIFKKNGGEKKKLVFISKTYTDGKSLMHYRVLNTVHQQFSDIVQTPRPILYHDEAKTFWQEQLPGRPLLDMLHFANWDALFTHLGELVAQFHSKNFVELPRNISFEKIVIDADEDARMVGWLLPEYRAKMERIFEKLIETKETLQTQYIPSVPIHGALRLEQFLAKGNDIALLDFDATSVGDPLFDVMEFITSLQYMELTHSLSRQKIKRASSCFLESYFRMVPWQRDETRMAWYAVSFLLAKMYDSIKNIDRNALKAMFKAIEIQQLWFRKLESKTTNSSLLSLPREFA